MAASRRDLGQRDEDEPPLRQPGMGDHEARRLEDNGTGKKDVDIDPPRAVPGAGGPAHPSLDFLDRGEELVRPQAGFDFDNLVQEPGLAFPTNRLG